MQSIISEVVKRLEEGDSLPYNGVTDLLRAVAKTAEPANESTAQIIQRYQDSLPEPQRSILRKRREGMSTCDIAASIGLQPSAVRRTIAKLYADLRLRI